MELRPYGTKEPIKPLEIQPKPDKIEDNIRNLPPQAGQLLEDLIIFAQYVDEDLPGLMQIPITHTMTD